MACRPLVHRIHPPFCMRCGKELVRSDGEYCVDCARRRHAYDRGRALFRYDDRMRDSIAAYKYRGRREYKNFYADEMAMAFEELVKRWDPEVLIPIPLHPMRRRKRGYNQAELLAEELGRRWGIPVDRKVLCRTWNTQAQKHLSLKERRKNMQTAFKMVKRAVDYRRVLLIDDIYTTGSTMDAAAGVLKENGVRKVYFLCISIGSGS